MIVVFDLGTTRLKVSAFSFSGQLLGQSSSRNVIHTEGSKSWQSAQEWWGQCVSGFKELVHEYELQTHHIAGFSVSGRAGACIFVGKDNEILAEPWSDNRHRAESLELNHSHADSSLYANTLIAKYLWLAKHQPRDAEKTVKLLYAKDFLIFKLTGEFVTDPSSGPDGFEWHTDIDRTLLPAVELPWTIAGTLTTEAAAELNLKPGTPVAVGAHDGICANTGAAMIGEKDYALTLGTHAVCRTVTKASHRHAHRFYCYPPDRHVYGGNTLYAGRMIDWALTTLLGHTNDLTPGQLEELNAVIASVPVGAGGVTFLPYSGGQVSPESRAAGNGVFHGMDLTSSTPELLRAVFEGTAVAVMRSYRQLAQDLGDATAITLTGGGIVFTAWLGLLADLLESPLRITDSSCEGRGAAIFCGMAIGEFKDLHDAVSAMQQPAVTMEPSTSWDSYQPLVIRFERLNSLY